MTDYEMTLAYRGAAEALVDEAAERDGCYPHMVMVYQCLAVAEDWGFRYCEAAESLLHAEILRRRAAWGD